MAGRAGADDDRDRPLTRQALSFALGGLPSPTSVTIDLSRATHSAVGILTSVPAIQIGSGGGAPVEFSALRIQPQRIEIEILAAPPVLTITLQVACDGPFLFGWLHVSEDVRSTVATSVERLRIVGPGYWAVPVWEPVVPSAKPDRAFAEEVPVITHHRQTARIAPERASETESVKPEKGRP